MNDPTPHQNDEQLQIQAAYANIYNELVKPDKVFVATQYFRKKWVPRLNPNLAWLIIALRQHCYWNKKTDELRDWCVVDQAELATEVGVDARSIRRLLKKEYADKFILEVNINRYRYDQNLGKRVRKKSFFRIRLDDPLTPEDEEIIRQRLAQELSSLSMDAETGQLDMLDLLDKPLSAFPLDQADKESASSPKKGRRTALSDQADKESASSGRLAHASGQPDNLSAGSDPPFHPPDQPDKESLRPTNRTKGPPYHIPDNLAAKSGHQPDKMSAISYSGQPVRNLNSTNISPDSLKIEQQQQYPLAAVAVSMAEFGIGEPALSKYKHKPPDQILGWLAYAREKALGPGYVINRLDADEWPPLPRPAASTAALAETRQAALQAAETEQLARLRAAGLRPEDLAAWAATLDQLKLQMTKATFDTLLKEAEPIRRENDTLVIGVVGDHALEWLKNRHRRDIEQAAARNGLNSPLAFELKDQAPSTPDQAAN